MNKRVILIIMDGWGKTTNPKASAIAQAKTPFVNSLYQNYPHSELFTHSEYVGLPEGQMGNSEVGHLNIGAGRIVYQELLRVNVAIKSGEMVLKNFFASHQPKSFAIAHQGTSPEGSKYFIGNLTTSTGNYRTYVYAKTVGANLVIQKMSFEEQ